MLSTEIAAGTPPEGLAELDRRSCERHAARGVVLVRPEGPAGTAARPARLLDVSRGGMCLLLSEAYAPGTRLTVAPFGWEDPFLGVVQVVHARQRDGYWILGCRFPSKLGHRELREWLHYHSRR
jgi:hypothetical protein